MCTNEPRPWSDQALIIGLIALRGLLRFRNWKFLLLSVAFLVISISPLVQFLGYIQLPDSSLLQVLVVLQTQALRYLLPTIALLLLAVVYTDELKNVTVRIGRTGWMTFGILVASYAILAMVSLTIDNPNTLTGQFFVAPQLIDGWIFSRLSWWQ